MKETESRSKGTYIDPTWYRVLGLSHKAFAELEPSEKRAKYKTAIQYLDLYMQKATDVDRESGMIIRKTILVMESRLEKLK